MATKKTTTKAKTKTSNSKTTAAAKATTKPATTKTSAAKTTKPAKTEQAAAASATNTRRGINLLQLRRLNMFAAAVFLLLAALAATTMSTASRQLTMSHLAKDELITSDAGAVLAPATRAVYDVELRWVVVTLLVLSALLPLLYVTKMEQKYADRLRNGRVVWWRWADLALTSALMVETVAVLSGIHDLVALKLLGGLVATTYFLGWVAERQNQGNMRDRSAYLVSLFTGIVPWVVIAASAVASVVYGSVRAPWYVYALYVVLAAGFVLLMRNQSRQHRRAGAVADYQVAERNYLRINMLTKAAFALVLIIGLQ